MARTPHVLTVEHCKEIMSQNLMIGRTATTAFYYNPWKNEYSIWHLGSFVTSGNAVEEMLDEYNQLAAEQRAERNEH